MVSKKTEMKPAVRGSGSILLPSSCRRLIFSACLTLLPASAGIATAQTIIEGGPQCDACTISIVSWDRIGGDEDSDAWLPIFPAGAAALGEDRIALTFSSFQEPTWYSLSDGRTGAIGRVGEGPGEYEWATVIENLPGDSLLVFDRLRATVTGPGGEFVRTVRLEMLATEAVILSWPDNVVVTSRVNSPMLAGFSLHTLNFSGSVAERVRSFAENRPYVATRASQYERTIARSPGHGLVAARTRRYEIVRYTDDGSVIGTWERVADWAPPNPGSVLGGPKSAPTWRLIGLHVDEQDRVWVYTRVGRPDWRAVWEAAGIEELPDAGEGRVEGLPKGSDLMITRVEVIDLDRGVVLAQDEIDDGYVYHILDDGRVLLISYDEIGAPIVHLAELRLDGLD